MKKESDDLEPSMGLECFYCGERQVARANKYGASEPKSHKCPAMNGQRMPFAPSGHVIKMNRSARKALDGAPTRGYQMVSMSRGRRDNETPEMFAPISEMESFEPTDSI